MNVSIDSTTNVWPSLPLEAWRETYCSFTFVDADCRQDSPLAKPVGESLMAYHVVCDS